MTSNSEIERQFHDTWARSMDISNIKVLDSWSSDATPETYWIRNQMGDIRNLRVLELGSGLGEGAVFLALQGAHVTATDLSPEMLKVVKSLAYANGVRVQTAIASASDLSEFPDGSFDIVYAANLLHHVDIGDCIKEIHRVLGPGGRMFTWDPIHYNPAIKVYRKLATEVRTPEEHPLRGSDLRLIRKQFGNVQARFFWLTALLIFFRFFFIDRLSPNEYRYWKLVVDRREAHGRFLRISHQVDRVLMLIFPPIKWLCWNIAIIAKKS